MEAAVVLFLVKHVHETRRAKENGNERGLRAKKEELFKTFLVVFFFGGGKGIGVFAVLFFFFLKRFGVCFDVVSFLNTRAQTGTYFEEGEGTGGDELGRVVGDGGGGSKAFFIH